MTSFARQLVGLAKRVVSLTTVLTLLLAACGGGTSTPALDQEQISDIAWEALEPNTNSHDRANWSVVEAQSVSGHSVAEEFEGRVSYKYCGGPELPPNGEIDPSQTYWYVEMRPQPATPSGQSMSPTAPPLVPEPFLRQALFLIDENGEVVARVLACVVY